MPPRRRKSAETTVTTETTTETASARGGGDEENADARAPAKKIKSRSGQRKKKTTNAAEALKDIGTNAVNAEEDGVNAEEDAAAREGSGDVFDLLRGENSATMLFSNEWRARYNASEIAAVAEIYSLLCKAAGCTTGVSAMELQRSDCLTIMNRIVNDMASGNLFGEDPLSKRSQDFKGFRENFLEFIDKCVRNTSEGEELYDGTLFASLAEIVATCASSKARPLRMAATLMALQIITSLITVVNNLQKARDLKQNQMDNELKKKTVAADLVKSLQRAIDNAQEQIELVEGYMNEMFTKVYTHRFRDCDEHIRAECMKAMGKWMFKHQLVFLTDFYLKYLGWSLNDKSAAVRLEVLFALKNLASSQSHLAMMDTFIARFKERIAEMLCDVDARVVVEAVRLAAVLHEHTELDAEHMNFVTALIMDRHPTIRVAAAKATKTLIHTLTETYRRARDLSYNDDEDSAHLRELHGIAQLLADLGDENGGHGKVIEGLASAYDVLSQHKFIAQVLTEDMEMEDAAMMANIMILSMRHGMGEDVSKPYAKSASRQTAKQRQAIETAHEEITIEVGNLLPELFMKYQAEAQVIAPLVEAVRFIKLERYTLRHEEEKFTAIAEQIKDIFFKHSDKRTLEACGEAFNYFCNEGFEATAPFAQPILDSAVHDLSSRLSATLKKVRALMAKGDKIVANENEGHAFELRMCLSRVHALISKCNISSGVHMMNDLSQYVADASRTTTTPGKEAVALASSSVSFALIWQALELMDSETTTSVQVNEHLAERDAFVSNVMHILRRVMDTFPNADTDSLRRSLISTICDMELYYYNASTLPAAHPAAALQLKLNASDSSEIWTHCTALITPDDAQQDADMESARLAYRMALHEQQIASNGSCGADFLSNFKIAGPWTDAVIRTYCNDLRRSGPHVLARAVLSAMQTAYAEVLQADLGNRQLLIDAFADLSKRLSELFTLSSKRDRLVMRIFFEEAVRSVVFPDPDYDKFAFLAYGLTPLLPKLSAVDAKVLTHTVDDVLNKVDSEDARCAPLVEFADQLNSRAKGASADRQRKRDIPAGQAPAPVKKPKKQAIAPAAIERDDPIEDSVDTHTLDDGPVEAQPVRSSRRR